MKLSSKCSSRIFENGEKERRGKREARIYKNKVKITMTNLKPSNKYIYIYEHVNYKNLREAKYATIYIKERDPLSKKEKNRRKEDSPLFTYENTLTNLKQLLSEPYTRFMDTE